MVACGPFTLMDDLEFSPLLDLLQRIEDMKPHLVILMGPFLDARNKKIEGGDLERTYQEEFDACLDKLYRYIPKYTTYNKGSLQGVICLMKTMLVHL